MLKKFTVLTIFLGVLLAVAPVLADDAGDIETFNVDSEFDKFGRPSLSATLRVVSEEAYFYIENKWWNSLTSSEKTDVLNQIEDAADDFDVEIYPVVTSLFGNEGEPGIDNDARVTILITELTEGAGGYFLSGNGYPGNNIPDSNEREMFYMNTRFVGSGVFDDFLAHELQHLSTFNVKERQKGLVEDIWLNELRSEYAPEAVGLYNALSGSLLEQRINRFLQEPSTSITEWKNNGFDYGQVTLLAQYLGERFGHNFYQEIMKTESVGIQSITEALEIIGEDTTFGEVYHDWVVTNWINDKTVSDGKYGYGKKALKNEIKLSPTTTFVVGEESEINFSSSIKDWTGQWYEVVASNTEVNSALNVDLDFDAGGGFQFLTIITENEDGKKNVITEKTISGNGRIKIPDFGKKIRSAVIIPTIGVKKAGFGKKEPSRIFQLTINTSVNDLGPLVSEVIPKSVSVTGGERLSIIGDNFERSSKIFLNGEEILDGVTFVNDTRIDVMAPVGKTGKASVKVVNEDEEESVLENAFSYVNDFQDGVLIRVRGDFKVYIVKGSYIRRIVDSNIFDFYSHLSFDNVIEVESAVMRNFQKVGLVRAVGDPKVYEVNDDGTKHWINMTAEEFVQTGRKWDMVYIINERERNYYLTEADILFR